VINPSAKFFTRNSLALFSYTTNPLFLATFGIEASISLPATFEFTPKIIPSLKRLQRMIKRGIGKKLYVLNMVSVPVVVLTSPVNPII
jgi:hypothetical protein